MHRSTTILGALILVVGAVAVPGTAHAAPPVENIHYEFTDSFTFDDCGFEIRGDRTQQGHAMFKEVAGSGGQAFLGHDNYSYRQIMTNVATGESFLLRGKGLSKEMTAVHVTGDVWEFTTQEVGQPFVIEDSDGNVVLRDRGRITFRLLFDTLGDSQPGGIVLEEEVTGVSGPHPTMTEFCDVFTDLIG